MSERFKHIMPVAKWALILVSILSLGSLVRDIFFSDSEGVCYTDTSIVVVTVFDSSFVEILDTTFIEISSKAQMDSILKDYFSTKVIRSVYSDSLIDIEVRDTIYKSSLLNSGISYKIKQQILTEIKPRFYLDIMLWTNEDFKPNLGLGLSYESPKSHVFTLGYDPFSSTTFLGYRYRIRKPKFRK